MKTRSEELLAFLARRTMLSLWAYPNVFRPSSQPSIPGKEIADVLAIFGNDVVCFSDKHIDYRSDIDPLLAWQRWYRSAVKDSAKQLIGARRYLMRSDAQLFEDHACQRPLAIPLPPLEERRIHLIAIARGAREACIDREGGDGFLMVTNDLVSPDDPQPFILFQPDSHHFVHILDETALQFLMHHLDTAPDLVQYFAGREEYLSRKYHIYYPGEHDLFLSFLAESDDRGEAREFPPPGELKEGDIYFQEPGFWKQFEASQSYWTWQAESKNSLQWDAMIEHLAGDLRSGHLLGGGMTFEEVEEIIRSLASANRLSRRQLMDRARVMATDERTDRPGFVRRFFSLNPEAAEGFLLICMNPYGDETQVRYAERMNSFAFVHAYVLKVKFPYLRRVTFLVFRSARASEMTYIPGLIDVSELTVEQEELGREFLAKGVFGSPHAKGEMSDFDPNPPIEDPPFTPGL